MTYYKFKLFSIALVFSRFYGSNYDVLHLPFSFTCMHFFLNPLFPMYLCLKLGIYMLKGSPEDLWRITWQPKLISLHMSTTITPHFWTWQWIYGYVYAYYITLLWLGEPGMIQGGMLHVCELVFCVCVFKNGATGVVCAHCFNLNSISRFSKGQSAYYSI